MDKLYIGEIYYFSFNILLKTRSLYIKISIFTIVFYGDDKEIISTLRSGI